MARHEIDFKKATFDDIATFAMNLLGIEKIHHPGDYDSTIAYYATTTHVLLGKKAAESAANLAGHIETARSTVGMQLDRLVMSIDAASAAADKAAADALKQSRRMVVATWGLVAGTLSLAAATFALVWYTRELARIGVQ